MVFGDSIVYVQRFGKLVDIVRLVSEKIDDPSPVDSSPGPGQNIP